MMYTVQHIYKFNFVCKDRCTPVVNLGVIQVLRNAGGGWVYVQALRSVTYLRQCYVTSILFS